MDINNHKPIIITYFNPERTVITDGFLEISVELSDDLQDFHKKQMLNHAEIIFKREYKRMFNS